MTQNEKIKLIVKALDSKKAEDGSGWIILDYSDVVVHVFYKEMRDYYQLERLWADGEKVDIEEYITEE